MESGIVAVERGRGAGTYGPVALSSSSPSELILEEMLSIDNINRDKAIVVIHQTES